MLGCAIFIAFSLLFHFVFCDVFTLAYLGSMPKVQHCKDPRTAKAEEAAALLPLLFWNTIPDHTKRVLHVGFKLATNIIQFYAITNLDKISLVAPKWTQALPWGRALQKQLGSRKKKHQLLRWCRLWCHSEDAVFGPKYSTIIWLGKDSASDQISLQ